MKKAPSEGTLKTVTRKAYSPPTLVVYGDLTRITQGMGGNGNTDGASGNKT